MELASFIRQLLLAPLATIYSIIQWILAKLLSPTPPPPQAKLRKPRIAIIGGGLTGVSAACHCTGHGFDRTIFEAGDEASIGGIWTRVNDTSGLQIHSLMYRFHPAVKWSKGYPGRKEIVGQVQSIWEQYDLPSRTVFNCKASNVYQVESGEWEINDSSNGRFDGVIAAVGTCGDPKMPHVPGQDTFEGEIYHSSQLDGKAVQSKNVIIIGGGASAVEALEFVAAKGASTTSVLARSEKWIIPRNPVIDVLLSLNIFGGETALSLIPEWLLRILFYRDLRDLAPPPKSNGLFTETPMVNDDVLELVRSGKVKWLRGDILKVQKTGIQFNKRSQDVSKGGPGHEILVEADTALKKSLSRQTGTCKSFLPKHLDICAINCTYVNAIGTVGNYHIGIYTRFLLMYLVDPLARPREPLIKVWINMVRWVKSKAPGGAYDFFTYGKLIWWFVFTLAINQFRWKWVLFVLFGLGKPFPMAVVVEEDKLRGEIKNE